MMGVQPLLVHVRFAALLAVALVAIAEEGKKGDARLGTLLSTRNVLHFHHLDSRCGRRFCHQQF